MNLELLFFRFQTGKIMVSIPNRDLMNLEQPVQELAAPLALGFNP